MGNPTDFGSNLGLGSNIVNLSELILTESEQSLLSKGLKFIPAPSKIDKNVLENSVHEFSRRLKITYFFRNNRHSQAKSKFRKKSNWEPSEKAIPPSILQKLSEMRQEIRNLDIKFEKQNLTNSEMRALKKLRRNPDIVIKPADKGTATVIMSKENYLKEGTRQLSNPKHYKKLETPIYQNTAKSINTTLSKLVDSGHITDKEFEYLKSPDNPRPRRLYLTPKIHKKVEKWTVPFKIPPGRPIVSDCDSDSYYVSEYLDSFLFPLATKHPSYIKDTGEFLSKLSNLKIPDDCILATMDVDSLYTNIDNDAGLESVRLAFQNYPSARRPDQEILDLLKLSLENNDFQFNGDWYLQIWGTAMGKKFAPNYANLFMANWEAEALKTCEKQPLVYLRFLDDIFVIWTHSEADFWTFFETLNSHHPSIKLKSETSSESVDFLDVTVFKGTKFSSENVLDTKVFFKPTDTHELLHKKSFHPKHTFAGILKSQILRYHRICSNFSDFEDSCCTLFNVLRTRGYSKRLLRKIKSKTLREIQNCTPTGKIDCCGIKNCSLCKMGHVSETSIIHFGKQNIPLHQHLDCASQNVIYLIHCKQCGMGYVGETSNCIRYRFNRHRADIRAEKDTSVARHFRGGDCELRDIALYPLEAIMDKGSNAENKNERLDREAFWTKKLKTFHPFGLNAPTSQNSNAILPFAIQYSSTAAMATKIARSKYRNIQEEFPEVFRHKFTTAYRRNKNLKDFLCSSVMRG